MVRQFSLHPHARHALCSKVSPSKGQSIAIGQTQICNKTFENGFIMTVCLFCHKSRRLPWEMGKKSHHREAAQKTRIRPPIHKGLRWVGIYGLEGRRYPQIIPSISQDLEGRTSYLFPPLNIFSPLMPQDQAQDILGVLTPCFSYK